MTAAEMYNFCKSRSEFYRDCFHFESYSTYIGGVVAAHSMAKRIPKYEKLYPEFRKKQDQKDVTKSLMIQALKIKEYEQKKPNR